MVNYCCVFSCSNSTSNSRCKLSSQKKNDAKNETTPLVLVDLSVSDANNHLTGARSSSQQVEGKDVPGPVTNIDDNLPVLRNLLTKPSLKSSDNHKKSEHLTKPFLSFHKFPKNEEMKSLWCKAICESQSQQHFLPTKYSYICSDHFEESDYSVVNPSNTDALTSKPNLERRRLKPNAVPFGKSIEVDRLQKPKRKNEKGKDFSLKRVHFCNFVQNGSINVLSFI